MNFNNEILRYIKPEYINLCKERMGATFSANTSITKIGFLVLGINPAGDKNNAIFEKQEKYFYLNYIDGFKNKKYTNSGYFKTIYDLASRIFDNNAKWDWCNLSPEELDYYINTNNFNPAEKKAIREHYTSHKDRAVTIYIGDLFYIHETSQKRTLQWIKMKEISDYVKSCLDEHISLINQTGIKELIIYVNNAKASNLISNAINNGNCNSMMTYKNCKIFFGSMISGGRAMDKFSRERLIYEIKNNTRLLK